MGTVTTGPARYPGSTTFPGSSEYPGQGDYPEIQVLYSTDDVSDPTPAWQYAHHGIGGTEASNLRLRSYSVSRGRENELQEFDPGTAQVTLTNRDRLFDPNVDSGLRPGLRWWIRINWGGATYDRFKGYAERYLLEWPQSGKDSTTTIYLVDEIKDLNLARLPVTSPPRDAWPDLVAYELADGYWSFDDGAAASTFRVPADAGGKDFAAFGPGGSSIGNSSLTPVVGSRGKSLSLFQGMRLETDTLEAGSAGCAAGCTAITWAMWFKYSALPPGNRFVVDGPLDSASFATYRIQINSSGQLIGSVRNASGTTATVTSTALRTDTWYWVVMTVEGGNLDRKSVV